MNDGYLLGIDLGTTSCKVLLFDSFGQAKASCAIQYPTFNPKPGWVEQDPNDWWNALVYCVGKMLGDSPGLKEKILGIGISAHHPGHVFVDKGGRVLRRAIIWSDTRAQKEAEWIKERFSPEELNSFLKAHFPIESTSTPSRVLWVKNHEPHVFEKAFKLLQPRDYLNFKLTGTFTALKEVQIGLINMEKGRYEDKYFDILGIPLDLMPHTLDKAYHIAGEVSLEAAREIPLIPGTPVVAGSVDALCALWGSGLAMPWLAANVSGTSEIVMMSSEREPCEIPGLMKLCWDSNLYSVGAPLQNGGSCLDWAAEIFLSGKGSVNKYEALSTVAEKAPPGSGGMIFLPYLKGERAPIWDPKARGAFLGISSHSHKAHLLRSIFEGVGYAIRQLLEIEEEAVERKAEEIRISGGGSRNEFWNRIKADILGRPLVKLKISESGALGAALLASIGIGLYKDFKEATKAMVHTSEVLEPKRENHLVYDELFQIYKRLYPSLKSLFR